MYYILNTLICILVSMLDHFLPFDKEVIQSKVIEDRKTERTNLIFFPLFLGFS